MRRNFLWKFRMSCKQLFDTDGKLLRWLYWDDAASTLMGVPTKKDVGRRVLSVKVVPKHDVAETKDLFVVQVIPEKHEELKHRNGKVSLLILFGQKFSRSAELPGFIRWRHSIGNGSTGSWTNNRYHQPCHYRN